MAVIGIAAAVIGIGAGVGSAVLSSNAKSDAIDAQKAALNGLRSLDVPSLTDTASKQDLAKYQADFAAQVANDPAYAALRTGGAANLNNLLTQDNSGTGLADTSLSKASTALSANSAPTASVISSLMDQAKQELAAGATLPPEFQAELVRSGLAAGGTAGTGTNGSGSSGTGIRTLLGSAGLQLQQQRQAQAESLSGAASNLQTQQQQALAELAQMSNTLSQSKAQRAGAAIAVGNATVPSIGLSGQDAVNLNIANTNLANNKTTAIGNLNAQGALNNGQMWSSILGSVGGGVSSMGGSLSGLLGGSGGASGLSTGQVGALNAGAGPVSGSYLANLGTQGNSTINGIQTGRLW
jgi:hypothetical protein